MYMYMVIEKRSLGLLKELLDILKRDGDVSKML